MAQFHRTALRTLWPETIYPRFQNHDKQSDALKHKTASGENCACAYCVSLFVTGHSKEFRGQTTLTQLRNTNIYIYAFSRRFYPKLCFTAPVLFHIHLCIFYPKQLTAHSVYTFVLSVHVFPGNRTHNLCAANAML